MLLLNMLLFNYQLLIQKGQHYTVDLYCSATLLLYDSARVNGNGDYYLFDSNKVNRLLFVCD